jgi:hypothetical protein
MPDHSEFYEAGDGQAGSWIDWRTLDPDLIRGDGVQVEELRTYRDQINHLLADDKGQGQYVLIVGSDVIQLFPDLDEAVEHARKCLGDRQFLIKQITPTEPVHSLGGATLEPAVERVG